MYRTAHHALRTLMFAAATGCVVLGVAGCNGCNTTGTQPATIVDNNPPDTNNGQDPALANMDATGAPPASNATTATPRMQGRTAVAGQSASYAPQQSSEAYSDGQQAPAPIVDAYSNPQQGNAPQYNGPQYNAPQQSDDQYNGAYPQQAYDSGYDQGANDEQQPVYSDQAPPPLPEYEQPPAPEDNDLWTPGYWGWGNAGYYWVPGAWVAAPYYGALWTPPYWGWYGGRYLFHHGYWGPHVGFYGGINYGCGYIGTGYWGGYWHGHDFWYNRSVTRVNVVNIHNVYNRTVVYNNVRYGAQPMNRVSYNGGHGGINMAPRPFEMAAMRERHEGPTTMQMQAHNAAMNNRAQSFNANHGAPSSLAAAHAYGQTNAIRATPTGVTTGRPGMNGVPAGNGNHGAPNGGLNNSVNPMNRGSVTNNMAHPGIVQNGTAPANAQNSMQRHQNGNVNGNSQFREQNGQFQQQHQTAQPGSASQSNMQHGMENRPATTNTGARQQQFETRTPGAENMHSNQQNNWQNVQRPATESRPSVTREVPQQQQSQRQNEVRHSAPQMHEMQRPQQQQHEVQHAAPQMHEQPHPQHSEPHGGGDGEHHH
ncbi:MAG: hypothetical protein PW735_01190 [Acidobacteriaceae bacterium]|nr:hypothetical protein [Acidobacteriaceae bacterium]